MKKPQSSGASKGVAYNGPGNFSGERLVRLELWQADAEAQNHQGLCVASTLLAPGNRSNSSKGPTAMAIPKGQDSGDTSLVFAAHNTHHERCGPPPRLRNTADPGLYHGYFENRYGEQFVFTFDWATKSGMVSGGDLGWDNPSHRAGYLRSSPASRENSHRDSFDPFARLLNPSLNPESLARHFVNWPGVYWPGTLSGSFGETGTLRGSHRALRTFRFCAWPVLLMLLVLLLS